MAHARIGKVRLKAGGAEIRVLHHPPANHDSELEATLLDLLHKTRAGSLIAFALVAVIDDGEEVSVIQAAPLDDPEHRLRLLGSMRRLEHRFIARNWPEAE